MTLASEAKQKQFVLEFCKDFNAKRAAETCGHKPVWGSQQLKKPEVQAAIAAFRERLMEANEVSHDRIIEELKAIAFASPKEIIACGGRLNDKIKSIELIAKHLGMFIERVDMNVKEQTVKQIVFIDRRTDRVGVLADPMNDLRSLDNGDDIKMLEAEVQE